MSNRLFLVNNSVSDYCWAEVPSNYSYRSDVAAVALTIIDKLCFRVNERTVRAFRSKQNKIFLDH